MSKKSEKAYALGFGWMTDFKAMARDKSAEDDEAEEDEVVPSELDEMTHAEMRLLYEESTRTILFAKTQQWRTVGSTLVVYVVLLLITKFAPFNPKLFSGIEATVLVAAPAAILILVIYQFWQHTEQAKLAAIDKSFSSLFHKIRMIKSGLEANVHRYTLLLFMVVIIVIGAFITLYIISGIHR